MPFASFRYLSARRVEPNLNQKVENATLKNYCAQKFWFAEANKSFCWGNKVIFSEVDDSTFSSSSLLKT